MESAGRNQLVMWLTLTAMLGLAHWFFGNLYEAVVISPNWVVDSPAQLARLNTFFVRTSPTLFFFPLTPLAAALVWVVTLLNREPTVGRSYTYASMYIAAAMALNVLIVSTLIVRLFGEDYRSYGTELQRYATRWNILNVLRMGFVAAAIACLFRAFRQLDYAHWSTTHRTPESRGAS